MAVASEGPRLAVLVSGSGTILEAIINADIPVHMVVGDRECRGIAVARNAGIRALVVDRNLYGFGKKSWNRNSFTYVLATNLEQQRVDLVAMAGFMTRLSDYMFSIFPSKVLNTHPSLLPKYKGSTAVRDTLQAGETETGCTIHIATAELDAGPIVKQERVPILDGDTEEVLHERIKQAERRLYPEVIKEQLAAISIL